eukprot:gnl/MRDRNA2_/MRDRNA2_80372_c0_seq1.p1 gnl/MRDRNA2_/MRDRNA2_80372_c0~~gnl/MRDRNA2_/MRDRNA2_80372_c0_seq1.p1  ORF type:complete len:396 (+),score=58.15 gnl/MRDRNA2_/MRDRNA2_80372_c0_seq1:61-1248(+)
MTQVLRMDHASDLRLHENDIADQVRVYDQRFAKDLRGSVSSSRQVDAFGKRDGTGVEAVNDVMETEAWALRQIVQKYMSKKRKTMTDQVEPLTVLDFGCGDGRYLAEFIRVSRELCPLKILACDISSMGLRSFHQRAMDLGCKDQEAAGPPEPWALWSKYWLKWDTLEVTLFLNDGACSIEEMEKMCLQALDGKKAHIVVCGWGTLSSIPPKDGISRQIPFLRLFRNVGHSLLNVVSASVNHLRPQRRYAAMRQALKDPEMPGAARDWLLTRVRQASLPDTYYYPVGKELLFYSAIKERMEVERLREAGFQEINIRICNVINFFDILTKPRAAKINRAVIALLEKNRLWEAQLLLTKGVAKMFKRPLSDMNQTNCIFDKHNIKDQVARYLISIAY